MSTATPPTAARERLAVRRRRIHRIRAAVATAAVSVFIALFGTIYVQMASGHDPALTTHAAMTRSASAESTTTGLTGSSGSMGSTGSSGSSGSTGSSGSATPGGLGPVTTRQS